MLSLSFLSCSRSHTARTHTYFAYKYVRRCVVLLFFFAWMRVCLSFQKNFARERVKILSPFFVSLIFILDFRFSQFFLCCFLIQHFKGIIMNQNECSVILNIWHFKWACTKCVCERENESRFSCRTTVWKKFIFGRINAMCDKCYARASLQTPKRKSENDEFNSDKKNDDSYFTLVWEKEHNAKNNNTTTINNEYPTTFCVLLLLSPGVVINMWERICLKNLCCCLKSLKSYYRFKY